MAGHSKWANIKHKKDRADKVKGKIFSRIAKEIIVAVKEGGADTKSNTRLRLAIQKAKAVNMPNDNIDRNITKASSQDQTSYDEITYELYGHGGVAIIVEAMTDNRNRFASEIRIATNKKGGNVADPGSVLFNFDKKGVLQIENNSISEDKLFNDAIEYGAEDFEACDNLFMITTAPDEVDKVREALEALSYTIAEYSIVMIPKVSVGVDQATADSNQALIDWIEDIDDVDQVFHNMEIL